MCGIIIIGSFRKSSDERIESIASWASKGGWGFCGFH